MEMRDAKELEFNHHKHGEKRGVPKTGIEREDGPAEYPKTSQRGDV